MSDFAVGLGHLDGLDGTAEASPEVRVIYVLPHAIAIERGDNANDE
jgi:hypothetical protein